MIDEKDLVLLITELEAEDCEDCDSYLDEGQQAELAAYYTALGRELTDVEKQQIIPLRRKILGEEE